jgi:hypothetical protein
VTSILTVMAEACASLAALVSASATEVVSEDFHLGRQLGQLGRHRLPRRAQSQDERDQPLLCPVVQVALDPVSGFVGGGDNPRAGDDAHPATGSTTAARCRTAGFPTASVPPAQVAEWAGHSVGVLLTIYAMCIIKRDQVWFGQIDQELDDDQ